MSVSTQVNITQADRMAVNDSTALGSPDEAYNQHYHVSRLIATYLIPFICILGLVCNTMATVTFLQRGLRHFSCSLYLMARSISDSLFLLNVAIIYLSSTFNYEVNRIKGICQVLVFVTYISAFVSVWVVILVTCENFIRIRFPFKVQSLCTTKNAKISIFVLVTTALCVYNFSLWISTENCTPSAEFIEVTQAFVYIDTVLTLIVPALLLTVLIIAIVVRIVQTNNKRETMVVTNASIRLVAKQKRNNDSQMAAVTKMLLAVSLTFFILNVPSHIIRIKLLISAIVRGSMITTNTEAAIQVLAQLLYYSSMAVNLFIYLTFGENFRKVFKKTFGRGEEENLPKSDREIRHVTPFASRNVVEIKEPYFAEQTKTNQLSLLANLESTDV